MNYPNQTQTIGSSTKPLVDISEVQREQNQLESMIQATFEASQELAKRLSPVLRNYPNAPQEEKCPVEAMSELASTIHRNRRSVESIHSTLRELLERLAL